LAASGVLGLAHPEIYIDGRGNYRRRDQRRIIVPYNRPLKRLYPDNLDFHRAAHQLAHSLGSRADREVAMTPFDAEQVRIAIDQIANTVQVLTLLVEHQEIATRNAAQDSMVITRNLKRLADALGKLQPPTERGR